MAEIFDELRQRLKEYVEGIFQREEFSEKNRGDIQKDNFIRECFLQFLLYDMLRDRKIKVKTGYSRYLQAQKNKLMRAEIQQLAESAQQEGIRLILLKGVALADRYYPDETMRITGDIDLFLSAEDLTQFMMICRKNGYKFEDGREIEEQNVRDYLNAVEIERSQHMDVIVKSVASILISVDVHISFFLTHWFGEQSRRITWDFYGRSKKIQGDWYGNLYELELHDLIIFQQLHFIQHLYKNLWDGFCTGNFYIQKRVNLLYELACMIRREYDGICWDLYCDLCHEYEIAAEMAGVCEQINQVFGHVIPLNVLGRLKEISAQYKKPLFYDYVSRYNIGKRFSDLLMRPEKEQAEELVRELFLEKDRCLCTHRKQSTAHFEIKYSGESREFYVYGPESAAAAMKALIWLEWNQEYLNVYIQAVYGGVPLIEKGEKKKDVPKDNLAIGLYNYEKELNVKLLRINFAEEILDNWCNFENVLIHNDPAANVLQVGITWKTLHIRPEAGSTFGFYFEWNHCEDRSRSDTRLNLSGNPTWHDVAGLKKIELSEL